MTLQAAYKAYRSGQLAKAQSALQAHVAASGADATALQLGAMIASRQNAPERALPLIDAALDAGANRAQAQNIRGNILRRLGRADEAEASYSRVLAADAADWDARLNRAQLRLEQAKPVAAAEDFAALRAARPGHAGSWFGEVQACLDSHQLKRAADVLSRAPLDAALKAVMGARIALANGKADTALAQAREALASPDTAADALGLVLQVLHMQGRWGEADGVIDAALTQHPSRADVRAVAGRALFRAGDAVGAATVLGRGGAAPALELARLEMMNAQGDFAGAQAMATRALAQRPGDPALMQALCTAALGAGEPQTAQQVAEFGLKADPTNQFYHAVKASAGRARGQDYRYYFDYDRFVRPYDLSPPDGWSDMASFNADLRAALERLHGGRDAPLDQSLRLGTQTAPDLRFVDEPAIQAFFRAVAPAVRQYLSEIGHHPQHPFLRRNTGDFRIRSAWSVRLGAGGHHINHLHPQGWISSAYYVDVPQGEGKAGWIHFGAPTAPLDAALGQGPEHEVESKAGRLVLFPSYLWHGTYPTQDTRLTLPVDILPAPAADASVEA